jgi:nucleoside-diphosphate-sugar epimerase
MNIALTGATGFAGRLILAELQKAGHSIKALARNPDYPFHSGVEIFKGSLADGASLSALVSNAEVIVHVAGAITARNRAGYFETNLEGTKRLYTAAKNANSSRFVYISSITAREPMLSDYAASKAAAEHFLLAQKDGPEVVILRPCAIYGPGDKATLPLVKALQSRLAIVPGRAAAQFSLIHVQDFARVVAAAAVSNATGTFEVDDLSGGHTWEDLAKANRAMNGNPQNLLYAPRLMATSFAACAELFSAVVRKPSITNRGKMAELYHHDWVARGENWSRANPIGLAQGFAETLQWYKQEGWLPNKTQIAREQA